ncbi:MAG: lysophospholipid acyltransferase family protein [Candidatus Heimdallarchaeota archaeon]
MVPNAPQDDLPTEIPDLQYGLIRNFVKFSARFGYRLGIEGQYRLTDRLDELRGGVIFAGNHESVIDAFLLGLAVPPELENRIYFLGKKSALWRNRFWGRMMDYFGVIPVLEKGSRGKNRLAIEKGIQILTHGQALGIFPEGHIRYSRKALDGKVGVARFAFETESPVVPVGIIGTDGLLPYGGNWPRPGKRVDLIVGDPIFLHMYDSKDIYDPYALRSATDVIMNSIRRLSKGYGIPPLDAPKLRTMEGINQILTPPRWLLQKKKIVDEWEKRKHRKGLAQSFDEWLVTVPQSTQKPRDIGSEFQPPQVHSQGEVSKAFLDWLDEQL